MDQISIITGDIVASRAKFPGGRERLYKDLKQFLEELQQEEWISEFEMFRGDSLQCRVKKKETALRVGLMIRAYTLSLKHDIRLSVGIGQVDFLKDNSLAHSDGEAFYLSGEGLDALKNASYRLMVTTGNAAFNTSLEPAIWLLDAVIQKWTHNQAGVVFYKLKNKKEEDIAEILNISQSAINQRAKAAQWFAVEKLVEYFEKTVIEW